MQLVPTTAKPAHWPPAGIHLAARVGQPHDPRKTYLVASAATPGDTLVTDLADGRAARLTFDRVYPSRTPKAAFTVGSHDERRAARRRLARQGDPWVWPGDGLAAELGGHGRTATSAFGPIVKTSGGSLAALATKHGVSAPGRLAHASAESDFAVSPAFAHGGDRERDRVGRIISSPLGRGRDAAGLLDLALVVFDEGAVDRGAAARVRPLLWAGYGFPRAAVPPEPVLFDIPTQIDHEWLRTVAAWIDPLPSRIWNVTAPPAQADLKGILRGRVELRSVIMGRAVMMVALGTLGEIVGATTLKTVDLGEPVFTAGPGGGLAAGKVWGIDVSGHGVAYGADTPDIELSGMYLIRSDSPARPFSRPGDSGTAVYIRRDGSLMVCATVVAGVVIGPVGGPAEVYTLAQPIERAVAERFGDMTVSLVTAAR